MKAHFTIFIFLCITCIAHADTRCPVCKRELVDVTKQKDDTSKPSRNIGIWNRSMCGNRSYGDGSLMCLHDNYAYDATLMNRWGLALENRDGFAIPLAKAIYNFPLPIDENIKSRVVYDQDFKTLSSVTHSLLYWCSTDKRFFKKVKAYSKEHGLALEIDKNRKPGESIISVEIIAKAGQNVGDNATRSNRGKQVRIECFFPYVKNNLDSPAEQGVGDNGRKSRTSGKGPRKFKRD